MGIEKRRDMLPPRMWLRLLPWIGFTVATEWRQSLMKESRDGIKAIGCARARPVWHAGIVSAAQEHGGIGHRRPGCRAVGALSHRSGQRIRPGDGKPGRQAL